MIQSKHQTSTPTLLFDKLIRISRLIEREEKMHPNTKASMNVTKYKEVGSTMRMQKKPTKK